ncbi:MAG: MFS transporter [Acidobacteria bacterium]|nr:MFS transporter [Acidobacteriota bacterium]
MPFLVLYLTKNGFSEAQAGVAVGVYGLGHVAASTSGGHLADRIGRRNTIVTSMFGSCVAMLSLSQAHRYPAILALTFLVGMFAEMYRPASMALIADLVPPERRIAAFGMYRWAVNLGFAAGPATAGFLANRSFEWVFFGDAMTSLVYGIIAFFLLPHGMRATPHEEERGELFRSVMRDRRFLRFLLASILVAAIDFQSLSTFPLHVAAQGLPTSTYGLLLSINGVMIVLFELALTSWTQHRRTEPVIALGFLLAGVGFGLTGLAHNVPALAATVVIWTLGEMVSSPVTGSFVARLAPTHLRGRYNGLWILMWSIGMVTGPALGTLMFQRNPTLLWVICGAAGVIAAGLVWWPFDRGTASEYGEPS